MVEQRLFADAITGDQELTAPAVPDREGEPALKARDARRAFRFIEPQEHFGVRGRSEPVALLLKPGAQLLKVVDLPVERHPDRRGLLAPGLAGRLREIHDLQASVPQPDA